MTDVTDLIGEARPQRFRRYPTYRDSGVEWLGEIPVHWEMKRLKTLASVQLSNVDKHSEEGQVAVKLCNYVDVYYNDVITAESDFMSATATPEQVRRFLLRVGDVVITKDSESWNDIAVPAVVGEDLSNVLCGYHLAHIRPGQNLDGRYLGRQFSAIGTRDQFHVAASGITRFGLGGDAIRTGLFPIAPIDEQRAIADFLDRETAKIDALVARKERLIELLQEKRTALITRAVSRGLDPNVPMKDSGVEWLGEIPAHWEVKRLHHLLDPAKPLSYGILLPGPQLDHGVPYIGAGDIAPGKLRLEALPRTTPEIAAAYPRTRMQSGELVYAIRGSFGSVGIIGEELAGVNLSRDAARIGPDKNTNCSWLAYALRSNSSLLQFDFREIGATITGVNIRDLRRILLPVPPHGNQLIIAAYLDRQTANVDTLIDKVREAMDLLKECRSALISAAVTGKIDVREVAPR